MILPIALHFGIGLAEFIFQKHKNVYNMYPSLFDKVRAGRNELIY
jgi:hypothetical protein